MNIKNTKAALKKAELLLMEANAAAIKRDLNKVSTNLMESILGLLEVVGDLVEAAEKPKSKKAATKPRAPTQPRKQATPIKLDGE